MPRREEWPSWGWKAGADIIGIVCAIWRGEGTPGIAGLPDLPVRAAMAKAGLTDTP